MEQNNNILSLATCGLPRFAVEFLTNARAKGGKITLEDVKEGLKKIENEK